MKLKKRNQECITQDRCANKQTPAGVAYLDFSAPAPHPNFNGRFPDFESYYTIFFMACPWFPLYTSLLTPKFVFCDIFLILVYIWIKNREEFDMTGVMIYLDQGDPIAMMSAAAGRSEHRPTNATAANATLGRWCSAILAALASRNCRRLLPTDQQIPVSIVRPLFDFCIPGSQTVHKYLQDFQFYTVR